MPPRSAGVRERQKRVRDDVKAAQDVRQHQQRLSGSSTHRVEERPTGRTSQDDMGETHATARRSSTARLSDPITAVIEEVTDLQSELKQHITACQLVERDVASLLQQRKCSATAMNSLLSFSNVSPHDVIRLNVGGELLTVPLQLLLNRGGGESYFDMLFRYGALGGGESPYSTFFQPPLLDDTGALFIDRDPATFRIILNYLRGSRTFSVLSEDQLSMLRTDAQYFQLHDLMKELGEDVTEKGTKFNPGPGVNLERNKFRVVYSVATIGDNFLITGCHRITFEILNSEYVGIGLVSDMCVMADQEFHKTLHCCVYYMTGVFYSNFPHHRKEDRLEGLDKGDYVSLMVDMNRRVAEYTLKDSVKTVPLGNARKLRFAVVMKMNSRVRIVPDDEAQGLPLFRRKAYSSSGGGLAESAVSLPDERDGFTQLSQTSGAGSTETPSAMPPSFTQVNRQQRQQISMSQDTLQGTVGPGVSGPLQLSLDENSDRSALPITLDFSPQDDILLAVLEVSQASEHYSTPQRGV